MSWAKDKASASIDAWAKATTEATLYEVVERAVRETILECADRSVCPCNLHFCQVHGQAPEDRILAMLSDEKDAP